MSLIINKTEQGYIAHIRHELTMDEGGYPIHFIFTGQTMREIEDKLRRFVEETNNVLSEIRGHLEE